MCGFAGFVDERGISEDFGLNIGKLMGEALIHRGPDDSGVWVDPKNGSCNLS